MGTPDLEISALNEVPAYVNGISYLVTEVPAERNSGAHASEASSRR